MDCSFLNHLFTFFAISIYRKTPNTQQNAAVRTCSNNFIYSKRLIYYVPVHNLFIIRYYFTNYFSIAEIIRFTTTLMLD